jgi:outer membrane protein OmpA-like peptidoglycan-associated protein
VKVLIYFISIASLYAQCGFLEGKVTGTDGSTPLVASISAKTAQGKVKLGKSNEKGLFSVEIPCAISDLVIEAKGHQPLSIPLFYDTKTKAAYFVSLELLPLGKQTRDEPYPQSEQTHLVLKDSIADKPAVLRRMIVEDALSGETLPACLCLYYTRKQTRECFELVKPKMEIQVTLPANDIVALEVTAPGYQAYNGNLILDQVPDSTRTYILKLTRQHTILAVSVGNPRPGLQVLLHEGNEARQMYKVDEGHFYAEMTAGKRYTADLKDSYQKTVFSTGLPVLQEGINLRFFRIPSADGDSVGRDRPMADFTVTNRTLYFPQSEYRLPADSRDYLDSLAAWLRVNKDQALEINGYTDNVGNASLNLTLSEYRVRVISKYLIQKGVPERMIRAKGLGSKFPVAPNDTEQNRRKNRRVEVQLIDLHQKEY